MQQARCGTVRSRSVSIRARSLLCLAGGLAALLGSGAAQAAGTDNFDVVAIAIVALPSSTVDDTPPVAADPGAVDPSALDPGDPASLGGCGTLLDQFLGNTEYLQPLIDFLTCTGGGFIPDYVAQLAASVDGAVGGAVAADPSGIAPYVLGAIDEVASVARRAVYACRLQTGAWPGATIGGGTILIRGNSTCRSLDLSETINPAVDLAGRVELLNFLNGATVAASSNTTGSGSLYVARSATLPLPATTLFKVKFHSTITLPAETCVSGACSSTWIVIPNKNPNTGGTLACTANETNLAGPQLSCKIDSPPFSRSTVL